MSLLIISGRLSDQCDQIGQFLKILGSKIYCKKGQMIGTVLGHFEKPHYYVNTALPTSLGNFWKKLGYFLLQHLVTLRR